MKKMVDGRVVDMTPEEVIKRQAEDAAYANLQANPPPPSKTIEEEIADLEARVSSLESR